jgi:hypothetical protein
VLLCSFAIKLNNSASIATAARLRLFITALGVQQQAAAAAAVSTY